MSPTGSGPPAAAAPPGRLAVLLACIMVSAVAGVAYWGARRVYGADVAQPVGVALAVLVAALLLFAVGGRVFRDTHDGSLQMLQAAVTVLALLIGALWFLEERAHQPHASLAQRITPVRIGVTAGGVPLVLVQVEVSVKNEGKRLLELTAPDFRLLHVAPVDLPLEAMDGLRSTIWPAQLYSRAEIRWHQLRRFAEPLDHEIEAGETDRLYAEYLVSCAHEIVKVSSAVEKPDGSGNQWKVKDIVDLRSLCGTGSSKGGS